MTIEEFENLTVKEISEVCRKTEHCYSCPYKILINTCVFVDEPQDWLWNYKKVTSGYGLIKKQNKEGH